MGFSVCHIAKTRNHYHSGRKCKDRLGSQMYTLTVLTFPSRVVPTKSYKNKNARKSLVRPTSPVSVFQFSTHTGRWNTLLPGTNHPACHRFGHFCCTLCAAILVILVFSRGKPEKLSESGKTNMTKRAAHGKTHSIDSANYSIQLPEGSAKKQKHRATPCALSPQSNEEGLVNYGHLENRLGSMLMSITAFIS